jgi:amidase
MNEVSVPRHYDGPHIWTGVILEGAAEMMIKGYGMGNDWPGYYTTSLQEAFARGWPSRPDDASETVKLVLLLGEYMRRNYHNRYRAKGAEPARAAAQCLRRGAARPSRKPP